MTGEALPRPVPTADGTTMTALVDLVPQLKRFVAVPGGFDDAFPQASTGDLVGQIADAFGEAQYWLFFTSSTWSLTFDPNDSTATATNQDLNPAQRALLVLFAGSRILESEIRNRRTHVKYVAGPVSFEEDQGASALVELLKQYQAEKKALILGASTAGVGGFLYMEDMAFSKALFGRGDWRYGDLGWSNIADLGWSGISELC